MVVFATPDNAFCLIACLKQGFGATLFVLQFDTASVVLLTL